MDEHKLYCSNCDELVVKSVGESTKIRSKVLVIRDGDTYAVCKGCGKELELPVTIQVKPPVRKSANRLYIKK